jgi:methylthioribose-1-phosphate isomerase
MAESATHDTIRALRWQRDALALLDQRALPASETWLEYRTAEEVARAIKDLVVRGAPAIGIAAAYGVVLDARRAAPAGTVLEPAALDPAFEVLRRSRPTAVNLFWALERMRGRLAQGADADALEREAIAIEREDLAANRRIGEHGAALIEPGSGVLTHCNTGSLATAGLGTALGVIRTAFGQGRLAQVFAGETRPWLQGARLTAWELLKEGIPSKLIADSAAAHLMRSGAVQWVIVGADRIAANGDTANKIGTYQLAISARHHGLRFMVAAPSTTIDLATPDGSHIDIELRAPDELLGHGGTRVAAEGVEAWNPVFDVTPAGLIDALVTERGVVAPPTEAGIRALLEQPA